MTADSSRPGSMRCVAERLACARFDVVAIHGIDAGDALALATRFDCEWAYRGRQALFWKRTAFHAHAVHDRYLPAPRLRPFERRGFLEVRGERNGRHMTLVAAQLAPHRGRAREVEYVRRSLRGIDEDLVLCLAAARLMRVFRFARHPN